MKYATQKFFAIVFIVLLTLPTRGEEGHKASVTFEQYWSLLAILDFSSASNHIHPADLKAAQEHLVPLFLKAASSSDSEVSALADAYFKGVPEESRRAMTGKQSFVGINNMIASVSTEMFDVMKSTSVSITNVNVKGDVATVEYRMELDGDSATDTQLLSRIDGKWYLHLKENPKDTAEKLGSAFGF